MSISNLGNRAPTDKDIGSVDPLAYFNRLDGDDVVIGTYDPHAVTTPLLNDEVAVGSDSP